ncbi:MAG TPA: hypothetical protein VHH15_04585, partial [Actinophytocola sp.]|nr:hypothetical protein [Actinophytocola sp.]
PAETPSPAEYLPPAQASSPAESPSPTELTPLPSPPELSATAPPPLADSPAASDSPAESSSAAEPEDRTPPSADRPAPTPDPHLTFALPPLADELTPFELPPRATLDGAAEPFRRSALPPEPDSLELSPLPSPEPDTPPVRALRPVEPLPEPPGLRAVPPPVWQAPPAEPEPTPAPRHASPRESGADDVAQTVLVGLPVGGYLSLWRNDELTYWRMADPDAVRARLGAGLESRAEVEDRRFREDAVLDPNAHTLFLTDRFRDSTGQLGGPTTELHPATEDEAVRAADDRAISELYHWLGEVALAAGERDEYVAVEVGGWAPASSPRLVVTLRTDGEAWHSVVETSPVPVGAPVWRDQQPVDGDTQLLVSPATDRTIRAAGLLTRFAVATWSLHPFQLGLTFGPNPTLSEIPTR